MLDVLEIEALGQEGDLILVLFSFSCDHAHLELYVIQLPLSVGHLHLQNFEEQRSQNKVTVNEQPYQSIA